MLRSDKVITGIEVAVVLDDRDIPTGGAKDTQRMVLSVSRSRRLLEHLHDNAPDVLPHPLVKDGTQKRAKRLSRHRARAHTALHMLNEGNEAEILGFDLLEKTVHLEGMLNILRMHHAQEVNRDFVLTQQAIALHHLLVSRLLALGHTVGVVQRLWTVEAESDGKVFRRKKAAPVVIEGHAVGLNTVGDAPVRGLVLALQRDNLAKIVQPEDSRFAAVPKEVNYRLRGDLDLLDDVLLQQVVGHAKRFGLWVEQLLLQVVTIVAVQVTDRSHWFGKDLKFT